ncbi:MAG: hypothetical protein P1P82_14180 [Bacteroidales bacterium]|nr:hypothetical protein [Bacteroidales bacterium]MDT8432188.1 hypothetical protein [Bacteroidales bacterium]
MKKLFLFPGIFLLVISCNKYKNGDFSGVLVNDINGNIVMMLGKDDGDWQFGDVFSGEVEALFEEDFTEVHPLVNNLEFEADTVENGIIVMSDSFMAYPTVTSDVLNFYCKQSQDQRTMQIVIVDDDYTPLLRYAYTFETRGFISFSTSLLYLGLSLDHVHRVYYKLIDTASNSICGHGDIVVSDDPDRFLGID